MKRINNIIYFLLMALPFFALAGWVLVNFNSHNIDISAFVDSLNGLFSFFRFPYVADAFDEIIAVTGDFTASGVLVSYLSYCVSITLFYLLYLFVTFVPLMCYKWIGGILNDKN